MAFPDAIESSPIALRWRTRVVRSAIEGFLDVYWSARRGTYPERIVFRIAMLETDVVLSRQVVRDRARS